MLVIPSTPVMMAVTNTIEGIPMKFFAIFAFFLSSAVSCSSQTSKKNSSPPTPDHSANWPSQFATTSDGLKIHFKTLGKGPSLLLLHGFYADAESNWFRNGIAQELAKTYRVIALDFRGHGKSSKSDDPAHYGEHMWLDPIAVLDSLQIKEALVHGYSMGGSVLTQLLNKAPNRILKAAYGGSGIHEIKPAKAAQKKVEDPDETKAMTILQTTVSRDMRSMAACKKNPPWSSADSAELNLAKITIPILAINGEYDNPEQKTSRMTRELANFKSIIFAKKSHLTTITPGYMPENYVTALKEFFR